MVAIGIALVLAGAALLVAEAHAPAGVLGVAGGLALAAGAALSIAAAGGGLAIVLPVTVGAGAIAGLWLSVATRKALATQALRSRVGREGLSVDPGAAGRRACERLWVRPRHSAEGARTGLADPDGRSHGAGQPSHRNAADPAAGGHHPRQRARAGCGGRLLPDHRSVSLGH